MGDNSTAVQIEDRIAARAWQLVRRYFPVPYNEGDKGQPGATGLPWLGTCFTHLGTLLTALDLPGQPTADETSALHMRLADERLPSTTALQGMVNAYIREVQVYSAMDALYEHAQSLHRPTTPLNEVVPSIIGALMTAVQDYHRTRDEMAQLQADMDAFITELMVMINEFLTQNGD